MTNFLPFLVVALVVLCMELILTTGKKGKK